MPKSKRSINCVILHCSATGPSTTLAAIRKYHKQVNKWSDIGYHIVIENDGRIGWGRDVNKAGAHCKGHNASSIGICMVGGTDGSGKRHPFSKEQFKALKIVLEGLFLTYGKMPIVGHNLYSSKSCPCFDWETWVKKEGLDVPDD